MPETWGQRFRHYLPSAFAPLAVVALATVAVCFGVILIAGWRMAYLPAAIGQTWFAVHTAPILIDGVELAALPALPAIGVAAMVASRVRAATKTRVSVLDLAAMLILITLGSVTLSAVALFMVSDASHVFAVAPPNLAAALLVPLGVHLIGFAFGIRKVVWRALAKRTGVPPAAADGAFAAAGFVRSLLLVAGAAFLVLLALNYARVVDVVQAFPTMNWVGAVALVLVCAAYVPNAAVATLGVLLGGSFKYADASTSLFHATAVPAPPLPLFAALPADVPAWAPVLLLLPAAVAVRFALTQSILLIDVAWTTLFAALAGLVLAVYTSGTAGAYGYVGVDAWLLAALLAAWTGITGLSAWGVSKVRGLGGDSAGD